MMRPKLTDYTKVSSGKVRDIYEIDSKTLLLVASDRVSAFDRTLSTVIPDKGKILTHMSSFFFEKLGVLHHKITSLTDNRIPLEVLGRAIVVKKLRMLPVECIVRGYLTGSGLKNYLALGKIGDNELPSGLGEASKLSAPIFTPTTKAEIGQHDENISMTQLVELVGSTLANRLREISLFLYHKASEIVATANIIIADSKLEFGLDESDNLILADEVFTPDSSRFWDKNKYKPGILQDSFDKQIIRNWILNESGWNGNNLETIPNLPVGVIKQTQQKYTEIYERITKRCWKVS